MPSWKSAAFFVLAIVFEFRVVAVAQSDTGTISGRIQTANGMSAGAVRVAALPVGSNLAADGSIAPVSIAETDSVGRYRLEDVPPGRYYIVAALSQAPTYYPGTVDMAGASVVKIEPDSALEAMNFQLQRSGGIRVSGRLIRNAGLDDTRSLTLLNITTNEIIGQTEVLPEGSFEFAHVPPGLYTISAPNIPVRFVWSSKAIMVEDRDVIGIDLTGSASVLISGRVSVEGGGPLHSFWLSFKGPSGWTYARAGIENARDGTMRSALPVGEYRVTTGGFPSAYQVESLTYGQSNLLRESLKVVGAVQQLSVVFKPSRAAPFVRVSGRFLGIANLPQQYDAPPVIRIYQASSPVLETPVRSDGTFEFSKVLPGTYQILGPGLPWSSLEVGSGGVRNFEFAIPVYRRVSGRVVVEGGAPLPPSFDLSLVSNLPNGQSFDSYLTHFPDGTFAGIIPEGDHRFLATGFPGRYKVVSITYGARDLLREPLRVAGEDATEILATLRLIPQLTFKVSGRVLGLGTPQGVPARTVTLSAFPIQVDAPISSDGSFEFAKVEKGTYNASSGSTVFGKITVSDRNIDGIEFRPVSQYNSVAIEVVTEDGLPKPNVSLRLTPLQGDRSVEPNSVFESGSWLPEGEYRVEVRELPDANFQLKSLTYGSVNLLKETLKIAEPDTRAQIVATIAAKPGATWAKVSGRVVGLENLKAPDSSHVVMRGEAMEVDIPLGPDGRFEYARVLPGIYNIDISPRVVTLPVTTIVVAKDNIAGIQLRVPRERMLTGRIVFDAGHAIPPTRLRVWVNAASGQPPPPSGLIVAQTFDPTIDTELAPGPDGSFNIVLPEGDHRIEVGGLPAKFYEVRSMTYGSTDLLKGPLKISGSGFREIVVTLGVRQTEPWPKVSGRVLGISRPQGPVNVVLQGTRLAFQTTAGSDGSFEFLRIPPDSYVAGTNPSVSAMIRPTVVANGDKSSVELTIPERRQVKIRAIVDGNGRVPNFLLTVRLNGTEGYQISAITTPNTVIAFISPLTFVCTGDVCTTARPGTLLNEPSVVRNADDTGSFGLMLPVGQHRIEISRPPPEYELLSATYGSTDLLKEPLRILDTDGEILLTFKRK